MKKFLFIVGAIGILFLPACSGENASSKKDEGTSNIQMEREELKSLVKAYGDKEVTSDRASINGKELIIIDGKEEKLYPLPKDEFFVSIAPYISHTHDCAIHSLTTCQGEMVDEQFNVTVKDKSGQIVLEESINSGVNGFIDLWLPRDQTLTVTIEHDGKIVESDITTFEDSKTCITTMQFKEI